MVGVSVGGGSALMLVMVLVIVEWSGGGSAIWVQVVVIGAVGNDGVVRWGEMKSIRDQLFK